METFDAIKKRVSEREYTSKLIDKVFLEKLIDAGRRAPSARAVEPWEFIVIKDKDTLKKLAKLIPNGPFLNDASSGIVIYCSDTKYYLEDGVAATENILLAASDLSIGACWIAGDKKPYANEVSKLLGVPDKLKLISLIALGWPKSSKKQIKNRVLKDVIHWEKF